MNKLALLKEYTQLQANDETIWFEAETVAESLLQKEIRFMAEMIEEATEIDMQLIIENKKSC
jgi:hypothetical protein